MTSVNPHIRYIGQRAMYYTHGPLGRNYTRCNAMQPAENNAEPELLATAQSIRELLEVRDRIKCIPNMSLLDVSVMIVNLCTN